MLIQEVESSSILSVAYDTDEQKLWLRFKSGSLYEYRGVEKSMVDSLLDAESKGKFFHENIKNKFDYERIEE